MAVEARPGVAPGRILAVLQAGYLLGDRVLRHARVLVSGESVPGTLPSKPNDSGPAAQQHTG